MNTTSKAAQVKECMDNCRELAMTLLLISNYGEDIINDLPQHMTDRLLNNMANTYMSMGDLLDTGIISHEAFDTEIARRVEEEQLKEEASNNVEITEPMVENDVTEEGTDEVENIEEVING